MRKVTIKLETRLVVLVDEGVEISDVISELNYEIDDTAIAVDILDIQTIDYEVIDSK